MVGGFFLVCGRGGVKVRLWEGGGEKEGGEGRGGERGRRERESEREKESEKRKKGKRKRSLLCWLTLLGGSREWEGIRLMTDPVSSSPFPSLPMYTLKHKSHNSELNSSRISSMQETMCISDPASQEPVERTQPSTFMIYRGLISFVCLITMREYSSFPTDWVYVLRSMFYAPCSLPVPILSLMSFIPFRQQMNKPQAKPAT